MSGKSAALQITMSNMRVVDKLTQTDQTTSKVISVCLFILKSGEFDDVAYRIVNHNKNLESIVITFDNLFGILGECIDPMSISLNSEGTMKLYILFRHVQTFNLVVKGSFDANLFVGILRQYHKNTVFCQGVQPSYIKNAVQTMLSRFKGRIMFHSQPFQRYQATGCPVHHDRPPGYKRLLADCQACINLREELKLVSTSALGYDKTGRKAVENDQHLHPPPMMASCLKDMLTHNAALNVRSLRTFNHVNGTSTRRTENEKVTKISGGTWVDTMSEPIGEPMVAVPVKRGRGRPTKPEAWEKDLTIKVTPSYSIIDQIISKSSANTDDVQSETSKTGQVLSESTGMFETIDKTPNTAEPQMETESDGRSTPTLPANLHDLGIATHASNRIMAIINEIQDHSNKNVINKDVNTKSLNDMVHHNDTEDSGDETAIKEEACSPLSDEDEDVPPFVTFDKARNMYKACSSVASTDYADVSRTSAPAIRESSACNTKTKTLTQYDSIQTSIHEMPKNTTEEMKSNYEEMTPEINAANVLKELKSQGRMSSNPPRIDESGLVRYHRGYYDVVSPSKRFVSPILPNSLNRKKPPVNEVPATTSDAGACDRLDGIISQLKKTVKSPTTAPDKGTDATHARKNSQKQRKSTSMTVSSLQTARQLSDEGPRAVPLFDDHEQIEDGRKRRRVPSKKVLENLETISKYGQDYDVIPKKSLQGVKKGVGIERKESNRPARGRGNGSSKSQGRGGKFRKSVNAKFSKTYSPSFSRRLSEGDSSPEIKQEPLDDPGYFTLPYDMYDMEPATDAEQLGYAGVQNPEPSDRNTTESKHSSPSKLMSNENLPTPTVSANRIMSQEIKSSPKQYQSPNKKLNKSPRKDMSPKKVKTKSPIKQYSPAKSASPKTVMQSNMDDDNSPKQGYRMAQNEDDKNDEMSSDDHHTFSETDNTSEPDDTKPPDLILPSGEILNPDVDDSNEEDYDDMATDDDMSDYMSESEMSTGENMSVSSSGLPTVLDQAGDLDTESKETNQQPGQSSSLLESRREDLEIYVESLMRLANQPPLIQPGKAKDKKVGPSQCPVCQEYYSNERTLKRHMRIHLVRPYQCPVCGKSFVQKITMKVHMRLDIAPRNHICATSVISVLRTKRAITNTLKVTHHLRLPLLQ